MKKIERKTCGIQRNIAVVNDLSSACSLSAGSGARSVCFINHRKIRRRQKNVGNNDAGNEQKCASRFKKKRITRALGSNNCQVHDRGDRRHTHAAERRRLPVHAFYFFSSFTPPLASQQTNRIATNENYRHRSSRETNENSRKNRKCTSIEELGPLSSALLKYRITNIL